MRITGRTSGVLATTLLSAMPSIVLPVGFLPAGRCGIFDCQARGGGILVGITVRRPERPSHGAGHRVPDGQITQARIAQRIQHVATPACAGNDPNRRVAFDAACFYAISLCSARGMGSGLFTWIWSRRIDSSGTPTRWIRVGQSCPQPRAAVAERVPLPPVPLLTLGMVQRAFRQLQFAPPVAAIQPVGGQTLVNLETFYRVTWPTAGVAPREIATVTLLGRQVRIRPAVLSYTYAFGDGATAGPTSDAGGVYPTGRIRHTYVTSGSVGVRIRATYTGDFSVDGGAWEPVDDTVVISGPSTALRVREARNQLEAGRGQ
jgi:hypothetical protein